MPEDVGTRLFLSPTKASSGAACPARHGEQEEAEARPATRAAGDVAVIVDRLYAAHTKSSKAQPCKYEAIKLKSKSASSEMEAAQIYDRISSAHTKASRGLECRAKSAVATPHTKQVDGEEMNKIVERLYKTQTRSFSAKPCRAPPATITNVIAREPATEDEAKEIYSRLYSSHTKCSPAAKPCKTYVESNPPGLGLKMLPVIEGLDSRFKGTGSRKDTTSVFERLSSAQTRASRARYSEPPKVLLYPERTLLANNVQRIAAYQERGNIVNQKDLEHREKWFN